MTLREWRAFWIAHGQPNDWGSITSEGMRVEYDPKSLELSLIVPFDPEKVGATIDVRLKSDFFGASLPADGTARPGPFQDLKRGENRYRLWNGLRLLGEGELP